MVRNRAVDGFISKGKRGDRNMLYGILSIGYSCSHGLARTQNNQYNAIFLIICSYHFKLTSFHIH
ncbi:hypothetical protein M430DRAFT_217477 [Amorphotheca resinae ATCC 22711]|uniref:Uncharacterized protein n=1 Tax=Amorphotheca resinae ATCC 22711 TaxID=857342 RepID=A0A2T3B9C5_AMORE|nr:hypothetical protein M430DRAFT_217477 [Amorphotheca resinae ATCC 22711]PSS23475.1 hypothetical protein M430DRAFT_217477 [Amorphotheca resinae ATCC 22711]